MGFALQSANWPTDGLATEAVSDARQFSHARQEDHAWEFIGSSTVATHPGNKRTYRYALIVPGVALQLGNDRDRRSDTYRGRAELPGIRSAASSRDMGEHPF